MRHNIKRVFWLYSVLFFFLIAYLFKLAVFDKQTISSNPYNPRLNRVDSTVKRGSILDNDGNVIAESVADDDGYHRVYNYPYEYSHITGYTSNGIAGMEAKYNFTLETVRNEFFQRIFKDEVIGTDIYITIDKKLQDIAFNSLKTKGAVIAQEPSTGKILAMVSYPSFDPMDISSVEDTALLNRCTQGLYPPGSVFKIVTSAGLLSSESGFDESFSYTCSGEDIFGEKKIHCFNSKAHGSENISDAFAYSCNTFFSSAVLNYGCESLIKSADRFLFNAPLGFDLEYSKSQFSLDKESVSEIVETAIGQGKTLVSPLHISMITSAAANNGIMMKPYIFDHSDAKTTVPEKLTQIFDTETAYKISMLMKGVVDKGTGVRAAISGIDIAAKTGTAENASGEDHAWFTAFAPVEKPEIAVTVVLENAGEGSNAIPIARDMIKAYLEEQTNESYVPDEVISGH